MEIENKYPRLLSSELFSYQVGKDSYELMVDPREVFPPSETTLHLARVVSQQKAQRALDIGTGSGLLAIVASKNGCEEVWAIDKNEKAVKCARENAMRNGVQGKVIYEVADFLTWKTDVRFDLILSNPPFMPMPEASHFISNEIELAINGGTDGIAQIVLFAEASAARLTKDGRLIMAVPHFVHLSEALKRLKNLFVSRVLERHPIRYWLAEYDKRFVEHIQMLSTAGHSEIFCDGDYLKTTLSIMEFRLP